MGKLQIKRGTQVPAQLAAGEPFFDGSQLHIGKLTGIGGNLAIGMTEAERIKLAAVSGHDKGFYANEAAIIAALPEGQAGWFCRNGETDTIWLWDVQTTAWVNSGSSGGGSGSIVEIVSWSGEDPEPVITADIVIGNFEFDRTHLVVYSTVGEQTTAEITKLNQNFNYFRDVIDYTEPYINYINCFTRVHDGKVLIGTNAGVGQIEIEETASYLTLPVLEAGRINAIELLGEEYFIAGGQSHLFPEALGIYNQYSSEKHTLEYLGIIADDDHEVRGIAVTPILGNPWLVTIVGNFPGLIKQLNYTSFYAPLTENPAFTPPEFLGSNIGINAVAVDDMNEKIYVAGNFTGYIKRLNMDGTEDLTFTPPAFSGSSPAIYAIKVYPDKIIVAGSFTGLIKLLNIDGSEDVSFVAPTFPENSTSINALLLSGTTQIIVGGSFGGVGVLRLNVDGSIDNTFPTNYSYFNCYSVYEDYLGRIFAGGNGGDSTLLMFENDTLVTKSVSDDAIVNLRLNLLGNRISSINTYVETTYAAALNTIANNSLIKGKTYKIIDRGGVGLFFTAISSTEFAATGTRLMKCPAFYGVGADTHGNTWIGVWSSIKDEIVTQDCYAIYGGSVWKNLTGAIGGSDDGLTLDAVNWELVPKGTYEGDTDFYVTKSFGVNFDWKNDWISKQWDDKGNEFGVPYTVEELGGYGFNPCDVSDWNDPSIWGNRCSGVWNNNTSGINSNTNRGIISDNTCENGIISSNSNQGDIRDNSNTGSIYSNTNNGRIYSNINLGSITFNSNNGQINVNSNQGDIKYNYNNDNISGNTSSGACNIQYNTNNGQIGGSWGTENVSDPIVSKGGGGM
jgi:hypothetical protein